MTGHQEAAASKKCEESMDIQWVLFFADFMAWLDSLFRRHVSKIIPQYEDLLDDPARYLSEQEVRIGAGNRYASGILLGMLLGLILSCGIGWGIIADGNPIGMLPLESKILVFAIAIAGTGAVVGAILYWLRGGEIILRQDGVDFRFRHRVVTCPWRLFSADGKPVWLDTFTLVLPVDQESISEVNLVVHGDIVETGRAVRTKQFRFRHESRPRITNAMNDPEVSIRDLYRAKLREIGELLLTLGNRLS